MKISDLVEERRLRVCAERARELRELADQTTDPERRARLLDSAVEYEGSSLTGDASHRAKP